MPQVPLSRDTTVNPSALPGARVDSTEPLSAFGGGESLSKTNQAARDLTNDTGKEAQVFALQQQKDADEVRVQEADLAASKAQTDLQVQLKNMQGKDALGAPDVISKQWKDTTDKIYSGLSTENQRQAFNKIRSVRTADLYNTTQNHVAVESKKYDGELTDAYLKNAQNVAATNFMDTSPDGQVNQSIFLQEQAIRKYGQRNGIPDELLKLKIDQAKSETHTSVIEQMLSNHADQVASDYYDQNKAAILPDAKVKVEKAIEAGVLLGDGQRQADQIFNKYATNRNAAFEYVKDHIKDPELRKTTETQLESMFTRQNMANRENNYKNYQLASKLVEQNQNPPGNLTSNLTAEQNAALQRRQKQVNAGVQPNTDWSTYYNLKSMAADKKNEFVNQNLLEYRHVLADTEFKDLVGLQSQLKKNDTTAQNQLNGFRTTNQVVEDTLSSAGINVRSKSARDQAKVSNFKRMVDEHIQVLQDQTQKKAKSEDVQKIADNLLINTVVKGGGWFGFDAKKRVFELQYKDVPQTDRSAIISALKKRGKTPTEQSVLEYYAKGIEYKKGRTNGY